LFTFRWNLNNEFWLFEITVKGKFRKRKSTIQWIHFIICLTKRVHSRDLQFFLYIRFFFLKKKKKVIFFYWQVQSIKNFFYISKKKREVFGHVIRKKNTFFFFISYFHSFTCYRLFILFILLSYLLLFMLFNKLFFSKWDYYYVYHIFGVRLICTNLSFRLILILI
jgi:hypothetical protein